MPAIDEGRPGDQGGPFRALDDGVRVAVRVQPRASRARIDGIEGRGDGTVAIKVRVTEPPEDGKANAAVIRLLAKAWGVAKRDIEIAAGATGRSKTLHVRGDAAALTPRLEAWLAGMERL